MGNKQTYKITVQGGLEINATMNHKFMTPRGWKHVYELTSDDKIISQTLSQIANLNLGNDYITEEMIGWVHGDGWYNGTLGISFNYKDGDLESKERYLDSFKNFFKVNRTPLRDDDISYQLQTEKTESMAIAESLGMFKGLSRTKEIPMCFWKYNTAQQRAFLKGLFSADGSISGKDKSQIAFNSSSLIFIKEIQTILATLGIQSRISTTNFSMETHGRYPQHKLSITKKSANDFINLLGYHQERKIHLMNPVSKQTI